jgi:hypothetical protein
VKTYQPDSKILIFAHNALIDVPPSETNLNHQNHTIKEYGPNINTDKMLTMKVSRTPDTNIRIKLHKTMVKHADKFIIYLGSEISLKQKTDGEVNGRIRNSANFYEIILTPSS